MRPIGQATCVGACIICIPPDHLCLSATAGWKLCSHLGSSCHQGLYLMVTRKDFIHHCEHQVKRKPNNCIIPCKMVNDCLSRKSTRTIEPSHDTEFHGYAAPKINIAARVLPSATLRGMNIPHHIVRLCCYFAFTVFPTFLNGKFQKQRKMGTIIPQILIYPSPQWNNYEYFAIYM